MAEGLVQVNVSLDRSTAEKLDALAKQSGLDNRSAFVRFLIRNEWNRHHLGENNSIMTNGEVHQSGHSS